MGLTKVDSMAREFFTLAGDDAHALFLLDALLDYALEGSAVDLALLRAHCAEPTSTVDSKSMDGLLTHLPSYVWEWVDASEEEAATWAKEILAALFSLRSGQLSCWSCLDTAWHLRLIEAREPHWIDCKRHHSLAIYNTLAPRGPLAYPSRVA